SGRAKGFVATGESTMTADIEAAARPGWRKHLRLALVWGIASGFTVLAVLPYLVTILPEMRNVPLPTLYIGAFAQNTVLFFLFSWVGLRLGESVGLDSPLARTWLCHTPLPPNLTKTLPIAGVGGLILGLGILGLDAFVLFPAMPPTLAPLDLNVARWKGFLASFYGGIGEEVF